MRTWIMETAGGLPRKFWFLWTGNLVNRSGGFVAILLTFYLHSNRGFSAVVVGLTIGLMAAGGSVGTVIGGELADRWGRRKSLLVAQLGAVIMLLGLGFSHEQTLIMVSAFLLGLVLSMARPAFSAMMLDIVPEKDRSRAFSLNYWSNNLAFSIAALLGSVVANLGYTAVFVVDAATTLLAAILIYTNVPESKPTRNRAAAAERKSLKDNPLRDRVFLGLCLVAILQSAIFVQYQSTLPLSMQQDGLLPHTYGAVISLNAIMIVCGQLFVPRLLRGRQDTQVLTFSALLIGVGFGLTAFAQNVWFYGITVAIWTVGEMLQSPTQSTLLASLCPPHARGRYLAAYSFSLSAAAVVVPPMSGYVMDHYGSTVIWIGCFIGGIVVALFTFILGPSRFRRMVELKAHNLEASSA
ncbi:MFS transporter [Nonomuraea sp. NPDC050786]|uniref:MDR family MFS transporter n=1 Tax=Nonomuraea sp. NPDC050786 TaxID=3154840 RepID=UPI0034042163